MCRQRIALISLWTVMWIIIWHLTWHSHLNIWPCVLSLGAFRLFCVFLHVWAWCLVLTCTRRVICCSFPTSYLPSTPFQLLISFQLFAIKQQSLQQICLNVYSWFEPRVSPVKISIFAKNDKPTWSIENEAIFILRKEGNSSKQQGNWAWDSKIII